MNARFTIMAVMFWCGLLASGGCAFLEGKSLFPPIVVVDEKTTLESQVLGQYEPLSEDLLLIGTLPGVARRGVEAGLAGASGVSSEVVRAEQEQLFRALLAQEYRRAELNRYRQEGWIGEGAEGDLVLLEKRLTGVDSATRKRVQLLVEEENQDRQAVLDAVISLSPDLTRQDRDELRQIFARQYFEQAGPGVWIEQPPGNWRRVSEES